MKKIINSKNFYNFKFKQYETTLKNKKTESLSILSYNVLADCYTTEKFFPYCNPKYLKIEYRSKNIINQIEELMPDIVTLQELDFFQFYKQELTNLGYELKYKEKYLKKEGLLVAWKKDKYLFIEEDFIVMQKIYLNKCEKSKNLIDENFLTAASALIVKLKSVESGNSYVFSTCHLNWRYFNEYVQFFEGIELFKHLLKFYGDYRLFITGDFNSQPFSNLIKFITCENIESFKAQENENNSGEKNLKEIQEFVEIFKKEGFQMHFNSTYRNYKKKNKYPKYTNFTEKFSGTLDYIFYSVDKKKNIEIEKILEIPNEEILEGFCPNENIPSDHLPIMACLLMEI